MSEADLSGGTRRLSLISSPAPEKGKRLSPDEFFQTGVLPSLKRVAAIVSGEDGSADYEVIEVSDQIAVGLRRILVSMALKVPKFKGLADKAAWMEGKIAVRLVENYSCHVVVLKDAEDMDLDEFASGKHYYFEAAGFVQTEGDNVSYGDSNYWQIKKAIEKKEGRNSEAAKDIRKVIKLIRALLYKPKLKEKNRETLASELCELRMKVGEAARAVVHDFIRDYDENDGWVEVIDDVEANGSYGQAMRRLEIGKFDLRRLV